MEDPSEVKLPPMALRCTDAGTPPPPAARQPALVPVRDAWLPVAPVAPAPEVKAEAILELLQSMEPMDAELLRATRWHAVLNWAGYVFRAGRHKNFYRHSFITEKFDQFISHSWHGKSWQKILLLMVMQNGLPACIFGTLSAFAMALVWQLEWSGLPGYQIAANADAEHVVVSFWSLFAGLLSTMVILVLWRPPGNVFLDRVCINQFNQDLKVMGIISLGAILKRSDSILVVWDENYVERLWCLFELAAFLKTHLPDEGRIQVKPVGFGSVCFLASATLSVFAVYVLFTGEVEAYVLWTLRVLGVLCTYIFLKLTRHHFDSWDSADRRLRAFELKGAKCWCCSVKHVDPDGKPVEICDREVVVKCVISWFGSVAEFEECVQSSVAKALAENQGTETSYASKLGSTTPILWVGMDLVASYSRIDSLRAQAPILALQFVACWLWCIPSCINLAMFLARSASRVRLSCPCFEHLRDLLFTALLVLCLTSARASVASSHGSPESQVLGCALFASIWLSCFVLSQRLLRCGHRAAKENSSVRPSGRGGSASPTGRGVPGG
ncbi:unnamed protein product [Durusdinium trenchii]